MNINSKYFSPRREMRCLRHKIHMGLFCAFGLSALNWIFTKSIQSGTGSPGQTLGKSFWKEILIFLFFFQIYRHIWRCLCLTRFTAQVGCSHFSSISPLSTGCLLRVKLSLTARNKSKEMGFGKKVFATSFTYLRQLCSSRLYLIKWISKGKVEKKLTTLVIELHKKIIFLLTLFSSLCLEALKNSLSGKLGSQVETTLSKGGNW